MKELSTEEKAKRYDEALKVAENIHRFSSDPAEIKRMEEIFPELREESEDERIRKAIINIFATHKDYEIFFGASVKDILAWLEKQGNKELITCPLCGWEFEKQGEQKPVIDMKTPEESLGIDSDTYNKIVDECIYGEQKPADKVEQKGMNIVEEDMTPFQKKVFCIIDTTIEEEQGLKQVCDELLRLAHDGSMQNPAWSEEDDYNLQCCIAKIQYDIDNGRIGRNRELLNWLKSLKDRVQLQSQWKPSEEQIKACKEIYADILSAKGFDLGTVNSELNRLEEQLKKPREE